MIPPGEVIPDDKRFGVVWMERRALASAFDMEGGFNDVVLDLMPGASVAGGDRAARPSPRALGWTRRHPTSPAAFPLGPRQRAAAAPAASASSCPRSSWGVASFLLNVAMARTLAVQRPQIAALKALGYANAKIAWHYVKWSLTIAAVGALSASRSGPGWAPG